MSHTLLQRHAFYSFFTFLNRKERLLSLFVTCTIIQRTTCSEMLVSEAADVTISGLGFSMGVYPGSLLDTAAGHVLNLRLLLQRCAVLQLPTMCRG